MFISTSTTSRFLQVSVVLLQFITNIHFYDFFDIFPRNIERTERKS